MLACAVSTGHNRYWLYGVHAELTYCGSTGAEECNKTGAGETIVDIRTFYV